MKEDDIIYIVKLTDEDKHQLYEDGASPEHIKRLSRYKISKKDYEEMIKKRNERGDESRCKCGHNIFDHRVSRNIYKYPAGKCNKKCTCKRYSDSDEGSDNNRSVST